nr:MAG TPA: hypothetical protein [Caudoviricetes sp.]
MDIVNILSNIFINYFMLYIIYNVEKILIIFLLKMLT